MTPEEKQPMTPEPDLRSLAREATTKAVHPKSWRWHAETVLMGGPVRDFVAAASPDRILALLDAKEAAETLAAASVEVTNDMTTAYMVGFEAGKEAAEATLFEAQQALIREGLARNAAEAQVAGLWEAAQAVVDEAAHPDGPEYRTMKGLVAALRAALESEATDAE